MVKTEKIRGLMAEKGYNITSLSAEMGIVPKTLSHKLKEGSFDIQEAEKMTALLDIDNPGAIFFANE